MYNRAPERCRSGRTGLTRNQEKGQLFPGFESLPLRQFTSLWISPGRSHRRHINLAGNGGVEAQDPQSASKKDFTTLAQNGATSCA